MAIDTDTMKAQNAQAMAEAANIGGAVDQSVVDTAAAWGLTDALLNDPVYGTELRNILALLNKKDFAGARKALENSAFYKNNSATVASRLKLKASQPGAYADALDKYKQAQKRRLIAAGIKVDPNQIDAILAKAYDSGLDENQLDATILSSGNFSAKFGGATVGSVDSLKQYASAFGMSYNQAFWDTYSKDLFAGTTTAEDIQAKIRQDAASAYPVYADGINEGKSLDAMMSAYKTSISNILEIDADTITFNDKNLRRAAQYVGPDGKPMLMPIWQFEQELRNDPRWEYTDNARATVDSLSLKVLRDWGMA
jgi:hypothetical protein